MRRRSASARVSAPLSLASRGGVRQVSASYRKRADSTGSAAMVVARASHAVLEPPAPEAGEGASEEAWDPAVDLELARELASRVNKKARSVDPDKCTACGLCWNIGHCPAISHPGDTTVIDADRCLACSTCVDICPRQAISMIRR